MVMRQSLKSISSYVAVIASFIAIIWLLLIAQNLQAVQLLPHQQKPIQYLRNHPEVKGLLIDHSLGSGKTFLSLGYAEQESDKRVVIIVPRFLKSNWQIQMQDFGVKQPARYQILSLEEAPEAIQAQHLSDAIIIIDEVHKLVERIKSPDLNTSQRYAGLYSQLRQGARILALTGTPIFAEASDLSYIINLVAAKDLLPFDEQLFRLQYTKVKHHSSWLRGYMLESKWVDVVGPLIVITAVGFLSVPTGLLTVASFGGLVALPISRSLTPLDEFPLREFDSLSFKDIASKYISFYAADNAEVEKDYPETRIYHRQVPYSLPQLHLFFDFADKSMSKEQVKLFLVDQKEVPGDEYITMNSSLLQTKFHTSPGAGREIGNLKLEGELAPKFLAISDEIAKSIGPVVVYSNYYKNGILAFADFLKSTKFKDDFEILHPDLAVNDQVAIINRYNSGQRKILLLHPEITEGVSLKGTEQLHILEPILNIALQDQVIGRVVRFKSHSHLPKERQKVEAFLWASVLEYSSAFNPISSRDDRVRREHWAKKYPEINDNGWTKGIMELDKNYHKKSRSPDAEVMANMVNIRSSMDSLKKVLSEYSIEHDSPLAF